MLENIRIIQLWEDLNKNKVGSRLAAQPLPQHPEHPPAMPKVKSFRQVQRSSKGS